MDDVTGSGAAAEVGGRPPLTDRGRAVVIGQGYVGLPVAVAAAEVGWDVVGFDIDEPRIAMLQSGVSPVEDITNERLAAVLASGHYQASSDDASLADFDIAVVTVPTPLREGIPDLSHIESAAGILASRLRSGATVILESTTYPGTTTQLFGPRLAADSGLTQGIDFHLGYSPERIDPGNAKWSLINTPKVVSGIDAASLEKVHAFYASFVETVVPVGTTEVAELTKLLENTFRHVNIALVNELAMFAHELDIDVWEAIDAASSKPFGYMRFVPGPGVGGHCLPIDPTYLGWQVRRQLGSTFRFVELANDVNEHMPDYVASRVISGFNDRGLAVKGRRILMLGMAYKADTSDARESPARVILERLQRLGADIHLCEPHMRPDALPGGITPVPVAELTEAAAAADLVLLLVDHFQFMDGAFIEGAKWVLDTRHRLTGANVEFL